MGRNRVCVFAFMLAIPIASCAALHENVSDPGIIIPVARVLKALRCEAVTYLVANRMRRTAFGLAFANNFSDAFDNFSFLDLDDKEYATIEIDLKTIDTLGATVGLDWKTNIDPKGRSHDWHLGPSLTTTKTYSRTNMFALPQDAELGPSTETVKVPQFFGVYDEGVDNKGDSEFFCYLAPRSVAKVRPNLIMLEELVNHQHPEFENFDRIYVDLSETLARWLEKMGAEMAKNYLAKGSYMESIIPGQINYSFALEIKPSIDLKYTMVATVLSPYVPDLTLTKDNTGTFAIYLNTSASKAAYGAKNGGANLPVLTTWAPTTTVIPIADNLPNKGKTPSVATPAVPRIRKPSLARPGQPPQPAWGRRPGVELVAPLPLSGPLPPAGQ